MKNRKKNILVFTENHVIGGANRYLVDLVNSIPDNFNVRILTNEGAIYPIDLEKISRDFFLESTMIYSEQSSGLRNKINNKIIRRLLILFLSPFWFLKNYSLFQKYIRYQNLDKIIIINGGYPGAFSCLHFSLVAIFNHLPTYLFVLSMPTKRSKLSFGLDYLWDKFLNKKLTKIIVNSKTQVLSISSIRGFSSKKIVYIYNPVQITNTNYKNKKSKDILKKYLFIGRVEETKGVNVLLNAFKRCLEENETLKLDIIGTGNLLYYSDIIGKLNIGNNVRLLGYVNKPVEDIFKEYDCFVFPSLWEGLPYVILEAMNNRIPIIATEVGAIKEILQNGVSGIVIPPNDISELANSILRISYNPELAESFQEQAFLRLSQNFSFSEFEQAVSQQILN